MDSGNQPENPTTNNGLRFRIKVSKPNEQSDDEDTNNAASAAGPSKGFSCPKCGKGFKSIKAVHGHMRLHNKGGKDQPSRPQEEINPTVSSSPERATPAPSSDAGISDSISIELIAAYSLTLLANADESRFCSSVFRLREVEGSIISNGDDVNMGESSSPPSSDIQNKRQKVEHREIVHEDRRYQCHLCDKSFGTHQALGGHTASHNKAKSNPEEVTKMHRDEESNQQTMVASTSKEPQQQQQQTAEHRCKTCGMAFPTGQALGGHMRRHYIPENHTAAPQVAPVSDSKSSATPPPYLPASESKSSAPPPPDMPASESKSSTTPPDMAASESNSGTPPPDMSASDSKSSKIDGALPMFDLNVLPEIHEEEGNYLEYS